MFSGEFVAAGGQTITLSFRPSPVCSYDWYGCVEHHGSCGNNDGEPAVRERSIERIAIYFSQLFYQYDISSAIETEIMSLTPLTLTRLIIATREKNRI